MKTKLICLSALLFALVSQLVCFSFFVASDVQRFSELGKTGHDFSFSIPITYLSDAEDFANTLSDISDKYSVSIVKSTSSIVDGTQSLVVSGAYTWETFPVEQLELTGGRLPEQQDEYLSSYNSESSNQCGTISSTGNIFPVIVQSLEKYFNDGGTVSGKYLVTSDEEVNIDAVVEDISSATGIDKASLLSDSFMSVHSADSFIVASGALLLVVLVSYILSVIAFPLTSAHSIGVLKLLGWSNCSAWWKMMRLPVILSAAASAVSISAQALLITGTRCEYYIGAVLSAVMAIGIILILSFASLFIVSRINPAGLTSRKTAFRPIVAFGLMVKVCIIASVVLLIQVSAPMFDSWFDMIVNRSKWTQYETLYTLSGATLTESDLDSLSSNPRSLAKKYASLYDTINSYNGLYILNTSSQNTSRMTVNANYLDEVGLVDEDGREIAIPEDESNRVVLVPLSMKYNSANIISEEQAYLSNLFEGNFNRFGEDSPSSQLSYIFYQDDRSFFLLSEQPSSSDSLTNPVIHVITEANATTSEKSYLQNMGMSFPMKMDITESEAEDLQNYIRSSDVFADNNIRVTSVTDALDEEFAAQGSSFAMMILAVLVFLSVGLAAGAIMSATIFAVDRQQICVKKLLGWGRMSRYGVLPYAIAIFDLLAALCVIIATGGISAILVASFAFGLDFLLYMIVLASFEKRNLPLMLKGE